MFGFVKKKFLFLLKGVVPKPYNVKIAIIFLGLTIVSTERIRYFQEQTILLEPHSKKVFQVDIKDSIPENNSLYQVLSKNEIPIFYYREIFSSVCFDNKCRPLSVNLYWNITGRYLGFELIDGEFLSKSDHEPFTVQEYGKLNIILAKESTPLADMDYNQLTVEPNSHGLGDIDAISSATPQNLAPYVIKGAAYTTFKLWHIIHGPTKGEVENLTIKALSPDLIIKILESPNQVDKIWALEHIDGYVELTPDLLGQLFGLIGGYDYLVTEKVLNSINKKELESYGVQQLLLKALIKENYNTQILVINKIEDCMFLKDSVTMELIENLALFNGQVFKKALEVLETQKLSTKMYAKIAELLRSENHYISNRTAQFLKKEEVKDSAIITLLKKYEN